ncbi:MULTISPECIES: MarR family transcriptional regulator [unclassified Paenibacillus]|uniref:MarR family winged helix-turn-helix transcriptional regulator n=1 Tax=unclassified Paenibacillus TaxID=185978 RepID=UPI001AE7ECE7|nr:MULTISPECIES: MarR family transcriptional regulator [unclassified Paenibacillus]MBP1155588.1 DNA-binding MarR family transcriptional regulator [Paenibacillus sp. PvP091]MBP1169026.1 DNA-binding MarR family transcriptional regulator [Paenibacillus sp. PvR098]MBP2440054.1 DNA-binding MarR family transcriptional regulator [Paenibacillus sp. PvP052]
MNLSLHEYISIIIHQTDLTLTSYVKNQLAPYNLAPEQNLVMMLLWEKDGLNQNEIAEQLVKDKTNVARMLSNLEQKGFIQRVCPKNDRRSLRVYLTEEGKQLGNHIIPLTEEFNDLVNKGITNEELNELKRILTKISNNVK